MSNMNKEYQLADVFEGMMRSSDVLRISFSGIHREIACQQGRADIVATIGGSDQAVSKHLERVGRALSTPSRSKVLSLLKERAGRTESYLLARSGLSRRTLTCALAELSDLDLIRKCSPTCFVRTNELTAATRELWAFEVKISNWQRAVYQALQYRAFSHYSIVVMDKQWVHRAEKNLKLFRTLNIGLVSFDMIDQQMRVVHFPVRSKPASDFHYYFALGRVLCSEHASNGG